MKTRLRLILLLAVVFPGGMVHAQNDTLYFDDFVDNRHEWPLWKGEAREVKLDSGYLCVNYVHGRQDFAYLTFQTVNISRDTFLFEIRLIAEEMNWGGLAYRFNYRGEKHRLHDYTAIVATDKDYNSYFADATEGFLEPIWKFKKPGANKGEITLTLTGGRGYYYVFANGELINKTRMGRFADLGEWGLAVAGPAMIKVDYMLLIAEPLYK